MDRIEGLETPSVCELETWSLLGVSGVDAARLLEGQLTCHVANIRVGQASLMAICNNKGRAIVSGYLVALPDTYCLLLPSDMLAVTQKTLAHYAVFFEVQIAPMSASVYGCLHPQSLSLPIPMVDAVAAGDALDVVIQPEGFAILLSDAPKGVARGVLVLWQQRLSEVSSARVWQLYEMTLGLVFVGAALSEHWIPLDLGYAEQAGISFQKGCYIGQEIIARLHYRGQSKYCMAHFEVTTAAVLLPGLALLTRKNQADVKVGMVLASVLEGALCRGLAVLQKTSLTESVFDEAHQKLNLVALDHT